jgi:GcrA cell cycle regulator
LPAGISGNVTFRDYLSALCGWRALGREPLFHHSELKMYNPRANLLNVAIAEGAAFTTYFADREPIDGKLTVVDLTDRTCRWPTGNPRDLSTFRYCGGAAHAGPYCERHSQLAYLPRLPRAA